MHTSLHCRQTVRRVAVLTCKQEQHSNCEGGCQTNVFLLQCNVNTDLLVFIKLKFLRILNFSQSFQEQLMTCSSCDYTIWERKKSGYSCTWIYFNIYFCITCLIWFMKSYTMRRTFVPSKVRRRPKLRGVRLSPYLFAKSTDFRLSVELHRYFEFLYWRSIYWKKWRIFNHELIVQLIPTSIWYDLLTVTQIWPSNNQ